MFSLNLPRFANVKNPTHFADLGTRSAYRHGLANPATCGRIRRQPRSKSLTSSTSLCILHRTRLWRLFPHHRHMRLAPRQQTLAPRLENTYLAVLCVDAFRVALFGQGAYVFIDLGLRAHRILCDLSPTVHLSRSSSPHVGQIRSQHRDLGHFCRRSL